MYLFIKINGNKDKRKKTAIRKWFKAIERAQ